MTKTIGEYTDEELASLSHEWEAEGFGRLFRDASGIHWEIPDDFSYEQVQFAIREFRRIADSETLAE